MHQNSSSSEFSISNFVRNCLSKEDAERLERHGSKLLSLISGEISPSTEAQKRFISVAKIYASPKTDWEFLWLRYIKFRNLEQANPNLTSAPGSPDFLIELSEHILHTSRNDQTESAIYLATVSANSGNAEGFKLLATIHEYGIGVPQNPAKAREYYKKAEWFGAKVEAYKKNLPDFGASIQSGSSGISRKTPETSKDDWGKDRDDYDSSDWEEIL
jgi:hypothetical protein